MSTENYQSLSLTSSCDFRKTFWGMRRSEVKIAENSYPSNENETHLTYYDTFLNLQALVGYHLVNDCLIEAGYVFHEVYPDMSAYIREFENVKLFLSSIYGVPSLQKDCTNSSEDCFCHLKSFPDTRMNLVEWITSRSTIRFLFVSDTKTTEFGLIYISRMHAFTENLPVI